MARILEEKPKETTICLDREEAANMIALLVGLLADEPIHGNHTGAAPSVHIVEGGQVKSILSFLVED